MLATDPAVRPEWPLRGAVWLVQTAAAAFVLFLFAVIAGLGAGREPTALLLAAAGLAGPFLLLRQVEQLIASRTED